MFEAILFSVMTAATPLALAAIGELVVERSGVLNLGVEGMMIMGAVVAFAAAQLTGSALVGAFCGMLAGLLFSLLFGFLTLTLPCAQPNRGSVPTMPLLWTLPQALVSSPSRWPLLPSTLTAAGAPLPLTPFVAGLVGA